MHTSSLLIALLVATTVLLLHVTDAQGEDYAPGNKRIISRKMLAGQDEDGTVNRDEQQNIGEENNNTGAGLEGSGYRGSTVANHHSIPRRCFPGWTIDPSQQCSDDGDGPNGSKLANIHN